eukprot:g556.t1
MGQLHKMWSALQDNDTYFITFSPPGKEVVKDVEMSTVATEQVATASVEVAAAVEVAVPVTVATAQSSFSEDKERDKKEQLTARRVVRQVEYYLKPANLARDEYLQACLKDAKTGTGWIPIREIVSFSRMQQLCSDPVKVADILRRESKEVIVHSDGKRLRPAYKDIPELTTPAEVEKLFSAPRLIPVISEQVDEIKEEMYKKHLRQGITLNKEKKYKEAKIEFDLAIEALPQRVPAPYINRALTNYSLKQYDKVDDDILIVLELLKIPGDGALASKAKANWIRGLANIKMAERATEAKDMELQNKYWKGAEAALSKAFSFDPSLDIQCDIKEKIRSVGVETRRLREYELHRKKSEMEDLVKKLWEEIEEPCTEAQQPGSCAALNTLTKLLATHKKAKEKTQLVDGLSCHDSNKQDKPVMHWAVIYGHQKCLQGLVELGVDLNE